MNIFKKLFNIKSDEDIDTIIPPEEDDHGKHVVRIMIGNKEVTLLLTDTEFVRALDRARRQIEQVSVEEDMIHTEDND